MSRRLPEWLNKLIWNALFFCGSRPLIRLLRFFKVKPGLWYFEGGSRLKGSCALTIDDVPGNHPLLLEVLDTLDEFSAKATFFVTGGFVANCANPLALETILERGHELGNHMMEDKSYYDYSDEEFTAILHQTEEIINAAKDRVGIDRDTENLWFRPPRGHIRPSHEKILSRLGYTVVYGDCFPNDPRILDSTYMSKFINRHAVNGSIIILHMPEIGFRESSLQGLQLSLEALARRDFRCLTLSQVAQHSEQ